MRAADLTPEMMLGAYARGIFPMALTREDDQLHWFSPEDRGIIPLDGFHVSRSLSRQIRRGTYSAQVNGAFAEVVRACADRDETWISDGLERLYARLHAAGFAHSVEIRDAQGALVGGVFGLSLGAAFFGESMVSRQTGGSKMALLALVERLRRQGFTLLDTQYLTPHLASLGGVEIPRADYLRRLDRALNRVARLSGPVPPPPEPLQSILQRMTQTS
ncbi:leucyl/phenylalanyl-tRNA--protein transferase [Phaeovulum vinaykumarii]|uniref:Leucyl/phenylalanyl-tRNA--protein transferase n=1 Tax=Phaeovulum vinaykumarii TaxID=407234 RepID=A0A1N7LLW8_9RHOB|nr:leucyl/phenylalanyl-tRNA--protein transferase [Phaeovulum vinaykumarii]SIS74792.1 leucyl/phenylalanyl-tRNA--protein transferase [Phaeovulum vinaykumarii]SOC05264.1 leucyl/phenylalanyl-tRNA--protein transferase [Phaeovulum vinaykumarii]